MTEFVRLVLSCFTMFALSSVYSNNILINIETVRIIYTPIPHDIALTQYKTNE